MPTKQLAIRMEELLNRVDLLDAAERKLREYSKGMLQRIRLAQALLNNPDLVFLDEPTSGLDPLGRLLVRDLIEDLRRQGTAVFLNSHLLSVRLCTQWHNGSLGRDLYCSLPRLCSLAVP
jgi:ABC-2 type transport system ATP-binding protein